MNRIGTVCIAVILCVTLEFYLTSKQDISFILTNPIQTTIQLTALLGMACLSLTFVLSLKTGVIESLFGGLDRMFKTHRSVAAAAFLFLTYHPILLVVSAIPNMKLVSLYIIPGLNGPYTLGMISYVILVALMIVTLFLDLPYHIWKNIHGYMGFALLCGRGAQPACRK